MIVYVVVVTQVNTVTTNSFYVFVYDHDLSMFYVELTSVLFCSVLLRA